MIALPMAPAERAERLTGRPSLSFSSISTFQACPLRWKFRYVLGLPEETKSANLVFGSAVHSALQRHFEGLLEDDKPPPFDDLMEAYRTAWKDETDEVTFSKGDTAATLETLAAKMVHVFQTSELAVPTGTILAVEEELVGEISPDCPPMLARLDLAVETDEAVVITDFKTSRSRWSYEQVEDSATQLVLYQELAGSFAGDKPIQLQFGVLTKTKEPSVDIHPVYADQHVVDRTRRIIERVWDAIQTETFYPAPSPLQCPSCGYRSTCRAWAG
ncbi:MAG: PD-(D/E)XK nuclease family protein [Planctomycetota bacterium]